MNLEINGVYKTRDGKYEARVLALDLGGTHPVAVHFRPLVDCGSSCCKERLERLTADGCWTTIDFPRISCEFDLMPPGPPTWWVNVYEDKPGTGKYRTRCEADRAVKNATAKRIACVEISDGEGLGS